ncbi:MFS transporter [Allostreptomyces psammosilenae]|uniref:MFS transporter n=1 Tax=Allostreptomyces psammosilenae TaxID=1892865 RepID=A0A852ZZ80_9ACTN|nr:MFS transporter [Allostreptomyces psammosilenae]NYI07137.1 hypothetical protein [Allostreptomyces psammosilenae]
MSTAALGGRTGGTEEETGRGRLWAPSPRTSAEDWAPGDALAPGGTLAAGEALATAGAAATGREPARGTESAPAPLPPHRDPNVLRWITAYTCAHIGDHVYFLALSWSALQLAGASAAGSVTALAAAPRLLLMLCGGVVADRFGPHRVAVWTDSARALVMVLVGAFAALAGESLALLVAVALAFGVADALFLPAVGAMPARLVDPEQLTRLQGLRGLGHRFSGICGPPAGGVALAAGGLPAAFLLNGLVFALSVALLLEVRARPVCGPRRPATRPAPSPVRDGRRPGRPPGGPRRLPAALGELADGLRHVRAHRLLGPLMLFGVVSELGFAGVFTAGLSILTDTRGWGPAGLGWLGAGFGAGATASALLLTFLGRLPRMGMALLACTGTAAVAVAALPLVPRLAAAVALTGLVGLALGVLGIGFAALLQAASEPRYLGRVMAVASIGNMGLPPLLYPLIGIGADRYGAAAVFLGGAGIVVIGTLIGLASRSVRTAELE